ncbi:MAG: GNAT family N-acetyltransferase [Caulobacteraceae bacterium]|nr:GNAT family N-acetyltransferase [Caulobacter sp.]
MSRLALRPYADADRAAVLAIFDANVPDFFGAGERGWLEDSLDELDGPAFLVTLDGEAVAFGGYEIWDYYDKALLTWGMAHPRVHGAGVGRWLLLARLAMIARETPATSWATVDTSPRVAPFFLKHGFETASVWPRGYRAGGTMHVLRFDLAATQPQALDARAQHAYAQASLRLAPA